MYLKRNNILEILRLYLGDYSKQYYLREICSLTKIPLKTTQNLLSILDKEKILMGSISGKNKYFRLNLNNLKSKLYLLHTEIYKTSLFLTKYPLMNTFLKELKSDNLLIVFGSFAKFTAVEDSDLDILAVGRSKTDIPFNLIPYKIHKIELSHSNFIKSINNKETLIKEIKLNHVILNNHSSFVNAVCNYYGSE